MNKTFIFFFTLASVFVTLGIYLKITEDHYVAYEMPDGTICQNKIESFSNNLFKFDECQNDNIYLNPDYYKELYIFYPEELE